MIIYGIVSVLLYALLFLVEPIRKSMGETGIALHNNLVFFGVIGLLTVLTVAYIQVFKDYADKFPLRKIIMFSLIFQSILFFIRPMGADDIFSYIYKARVFSVHGENPYIVTYDEIKDDAFTGIVNNRWSGNTAVYGPAFMLFSGATTSVAGDKLWLAVYLFKLLAVLANLLIIYLIYRVTKDKKAVYLYAWNPYILFTFAVDGHNDVYLILFVLLSIWFLSKANKFKHFVFAVLAFIISILFKYFSIIAAPFFGVYLLRKLKNDKRLYYLPWLIFISTVFVLLLYLPFWDGPVAFRRIFELSQKQEKSTALFILVSAITLSLFKVENYFQISAFFAKVLFAVFYLKLILLALKEKTFITGNLIKQHLISFALLFFILSTWFLPWYSTLVTAFLVLYFGLSGHTKLPKLLFILTFYQLVFSILTR